MICSCGQDPDPGICPGCTFGGVGFGGMPYGTDGHCRCCEECDNNPTDTRKEETAPVEKYPLKAAHGIAPACPMCGRGLAYAKDYGELTCVGTDCPRPTAAAELLSEGETEHLVTLSTNGYSVKHPIRERLDNQLLSCDLADYVSEHAQDLITHGDLTVGTPYRMWLDSGSYQTDMGLEYDTHLQWEPA